MYRGCKYSQQGAIPDIPNELVDQCIAIIGLGVEARLQGPPADSPRKKHKSVTTLSSHDSGTLSGKRDTRGKCCRGSIPNCYLGIALHMWKATSKKQRYLALLHVHGQQNSHVNNSVQVMQQTHAAGLLSQNHIVSQEGRRNSNCLES